jgi:hypothetical protein
VGTTTPTVKINMGDELLILHLHESNLYAPNAVSVTMKSSGQEWQLLKNDGFYRGYVNNDTTSFAIFLIQKDKFLGYYTQNGVLYTLSNLAGLGIDANQGNDLYGTFVRFVDPRNPPEPTDGCGLNLPIYADIPPPTEPPVVEERAPWYFEIAYDVDKAMYDKIMQGTPSPSAVEDFIGSVTMRLEAIYKSVVPSLSFHVVNINIWENNDIYGGNTSAHHHNSTGKSWWISNKGCVERDAVSLLSGLNLDALGFVASSDGVRSICGGTNDDQCFGRPFNTVRYFGGVNVEAVNKLAHTVAHELGHNFGINFHVCGCGNLMHAGVSTASCPEVCNSPGDAWDGRSSGVIAGRFSTPPSFTLCDFNNQNIQYPPDICLRTLSITNNGLSDGEILFAVPERDFRCPGHIFEVFFYDQTNASNNVVTWELGPYLNLLPPQANNRRRRLQVAANIPTGGIETWVKVIYNLPACVSEPISYTLPIRLNSSFDLEGTYVSSIIPATTIAQYINTIPAGTYTVRLVAPATNNYIWEEQQPGGSWTTLQWTNNQMDFTMPSYPSTGATKTFRVTVPNECNTGNMSRIIYFSRNANPYGLAKNVGGAVVYPNPTTGTLQISLSAQSSLGASSMDAIRQIRVFDSTGRLLFTTPGNGTDYMTVDMSKQLSGLYIVEIESNQAITSTRVQVQNN